MCVELGQGLKPCAEVGEVIVGAADVHDDGIKVVLALGDGKAAQEVHYKWTLAGKLVSGKANAGVVDAEANDAVPEQGSMSLSDVNQRHELFVLNVSLGHRVRVPATPVQDPLEDVPPAFVTTSI